MLVTPINKDVRKYEPGFLLGMTKRQFSIVAVGAIISAIAAILIPASVDVRIFLVIVIMIPAFVFAFYTVGGMPFEIYIAHVIYCKFLTPGRRRYAAHNVIRRQYREPSDHPAATKKSKKKNAEAVKYSKKREYHIYT